MVVALVSVAGQAPTTAAKTGPSPKTSWGEPNLAGIWGVDVQIPLQRPAKYKDKAFFTDAEIAQLRRQARLGHSFDCFRFPGTAAAKPWRVQIEQASVRRTTIPRSHAGQSRFLWIHQFHLIPSVQSGHFMTPLG
jgi:hypothetical protein